MMRIYLFRIQMVAMTIILASIWSGAHAQTPSAPDASEPQTQTLMQDSAPQTPSSSASAPMAELPADAPVAPLPAPTPTTLQASDSSAPPNLSDYLNSAGVSPEVTDAANSNDDTATVTIPTMDMNALQGGAPAPAQQESPEVMKAKAEASIRKDAFDAAMGGAMPLKPSEIRRMLELYDETKQASETPIYSSPEPESSFQSISLDPGTKPLLIKTAMGNVTTLSIVDLTGQPWPINDLTWAGDFQIEQPENGGHILRIIPLKEFATGNISMRLVGLNPPVIFSIKTERQSVHVRLDVQIPEIGPNGVVPPIQSTITTKAGDDFMTSVLVGVVPSTSASQLKVDGIDGRTTAYSKGDMMYIRTPYTMLSPAWTSSVQSGDGTKVYALNFSPVVLLSDKGKMVRAYLTRKEIADEQY